MLFNFLFKFVISRLQQGCQLFQRIISLDITHITSQEHKTDLDCAESLFPPGDSFSFLLPLPLLDRENIQTLEQAVLRPSDSLKQLQEVRDLFLLLLCKITRGSFCLRRE